MAAKSAGDNGKKHIEEGLDALTICRFKDAMLSRFLDKKALVPKMASHIASSFEKASQIGILVLSSQNHFDIRQAGLYDKHEDYVQMFCSLARMGNLETVKYVVASPGWKQAEALLDAGCPLLYNAETGCGRWTGLFSKAGDRWIWASRGSETDAFLETLEYALAWHYVRGPMSAGARYLDFADIPSRISKMTLGHVSLPPMEEDLMERIGVYYKVLQRVVPDPDEFALLSLAGTERGGELETVRDFAAIWDKAAERICLPRAEFDFSRREQDVEETARTLGIDIAIDALSSGVPAELVCI